MHSNSYTWPSHTEENKLREESTNKLGGKTLSVRQIALRVCALVHVCDCVCLWRTQTHCYDNLSRAIWDDIVCKLLTLIVIQGFF